MANLALVAVIGSVALKLHSFQVWLIYPCAVFIIQGAAWLVFYNQMRRAWFALVAAGWMAAGVGMGLAIDSISLYALIAGLSFLLLMALPGWVILRSARKSAQAS
ncbi:MAG: hypothetical protein ACRED9_07105 [Caulobacteraceae bacterium]